MYSTRKFYLAIGLAIACSAAWATNYEPIKPAPTGGSAAAGAAAGAISGSESTGIGVGHGGDATGTGTGIGGTGGRGGEGGQAVVGDVGSDIDFHNKVRSLGIALPSHSGHNLASPSGCVGNQLEHRAYAWNGYISTDIKPLSDGACVVARVVTENKAQCQWVAAAYAEQRLMVMTVPGTKLEDWEHLVTEARARPPLSAEDCANLLRPRLIVDSRFTQPAPSTRVEAAGGAASVAGSSNSLNHTTVHCSVPFPPKVTYQGTRKIVKPRPCPTCCPATK